MSDIHRDLEFLHASFQPVAETWLHICKDDLSINMRILETLRENDRQAQLKASGKSDVKIGWHSVGLALDFACFDDKGVYDTDNHTGLYTKCGLVAQALDCTWPIKIRSGTDWGHIEYHPGFTLQQFLNGGKEGIVT